MGQKTRIKRQNGQHVMYTRAPSKEDEVRKESEKILKGNRFATLATESEEVFNWQV